MASSFFVATLSKIQSDPLLVTLSAVSQCPPVGCLVFAPHLHQLQQRLFQVPQGNQIKICRQPGILWAAPLAPGVVPEGRGPLPAREKGTGEGRYCTKETSLETKVVLLEFISSGRLKRKRKKKQISNLIRHFSKHYCKISLLLSDMM